MTDLQATILKIGLPTCFLIHDFCEIYVWAKKKLVGAKPNEQMKNKSLRV